MQNLHYAGEKAIGSVGGSASSQVADFDFNYAPVSESYPAVTPGNYTVAAGDALRGIAYKAYGDSKLWYLIADANGLMTEVVATVAAVYLRPQVLATVASEKAAAVVAANAAALEIGLSAPLTLAGAATTGELAFAAGISASAGNLDQK